MTGISLTLDVEWWGISIGGSSDVNPPSRQVPYHEISDFKVQNDESGYILGGTNDILQVEGNNILKEDEATARIEECFIEAEEGDMVKNPVQLVLESPVQSGFLAQKNKTKTEIGPDIS